MQVEKNYISAQKLGNLKNPEAWKGSQKIFQDA